MPLVAVALVMWLGRPVDPISAEVIAPSVDQTEDGYVGEVRWVDEGGSVRVRQLDLTEEHVTSGTVPVVVVEGEATVVGPAQVDGVSSLVVAGTAVVAFLFAVVVLATVRGFGFVRGTGQSGEMTPDEVEESHAFYWRH